MLFATSGLNNFEASPSHSCGQDGVIRVQKDIALYELGARTVVQRIKVPTQLHQLPLKIIALKKIRKTCETETTCQTM